MQFESNGLHEQAKEEPEFEFEKFNKAASS
jgi:hypothetical protein